MLLLIRYGAKVNHFTWVGLLAEGNLEHQEEGHNDKKNFVLVMAGYEVLVLADQAFQLPSFGVELLRVF